MIDIFIFFIFGLCEQRTPNKLNNFGTIHEGLIYEGKFNTPHHLAGSINLKPQEQKSLFPELNGQAVDPEDEQALIIFASMTTPAKIQCFFNQLTCGLFDAVTLRDHIAKFAATLATGGGSAAAAVRTAMPARLAAHTVKAASGSNYAEPPSGRVQKSRRPEVQPVCPPEAHTSANAWLQHATQNARLLSNTTSVARAALPLSADEAQHFQLEYLAEADEKLSVALASITAAKGWLEGRGNPPHWAPVKSLDAAQHLLSARGEWPLQYEMLHFAANAHDCVQTVVTICPEEAKDAHSRLGEALLHSRDLVMLQCRGFCDIKDKESFLAVATAAFNRHLVKQERAALLNAYHKHDEKMNRSGLRGCASRNAEQNVMRHRVRNRKEKNEAAASTVQPCIQDVQMSGSWAGSWDGVDVPTCNMRNQTWEEVEDWVWQCMDMELRYRAIETQMQDIQAILAPYQEFHPQPPEI